MAKIMVSTKAGYNLSYNNVTNFKYTTQGFEFDHIDEKYGLTREWFNYASVDSYALSKDEGGN